LSGADNGVDVPPGVFPMNRAWKVEASIASVAFVVVVEPFAVVSAGAGTTLRYVLLRKLRSTSWAAVA
jgi:hypothetical protein